MKTNIRKEILLVSLIILILANTFNSSLSIYSFQRLYTNAIVSAYKSVSKSLLTDIKQFGWPEKLPEESAYINTFLGFSPKALINKHSKRMSSGQFY